MTDYTDDFSQTQAQEETGKLKALPIIILVGAIVVVLILMIVFLAVKKRMKPEDPENNDSEVRESPITANSNTNKAENDIENVT